MKKSVRLKYSTKSYKSIHDFYTIFEKSPNFGQINKIIKNLTNAITAAFAAISEKQKIDKIYTKFFPPSPPRRGKPFGLPYFL